MPYSLFHILPHAARRSPFVLWNVDLVLLLTFQ
jgi:hypothetical protein